MKRTLAIVGAAALAVTGAVAIAQAQGPEAPGADQRNAGIAFNQAQPRGPGAQRPGMGQRQGLGQRQGFRRGPQGVMRGPGGRGPGLGRPGRGGGIGLRGLDLTEEQRTQVKALHEKLRQDTDAILTPEQKEKLKTRRGGRGGDPQ